MEFEEIKNKVLDFRDQRDWKQFHNSKDLAISISIESAELLELFQWSGANLEMPEKISDLKEEIADVIIYCIYLADNLNIDILDVINNKIEINKSKYPAEKAFGNSRKYTEL